MKKIIAIVLFIAALFLLCLSLSASALSDPPFTNTGTFEVESAGLYTQYRYESDSSMWQWIVDDSDTSALLLNSIYAEPVMADHYYQDFADLFYVEEGDIGKITLDNGDVYYYVCTGVYDGYNNGEDIRFIDGTTATGSWAPRLCDLVCYTCDHSLNVVDGVRIVMFDRCEQPRVSAPVVYMLAEMQPK